VPALASTRPAGTGIRIDRSDGSIKLVGSPDGWEHAATAASHAYQTTPSTHSGRLAAALEAHLDSLAASGLLTTLPPGAARPPTPDDDARWLAAAGGHPRHAGEDGWRRLLGSEADIRMAFRHATADLHPRQGAERDAALVRRDRLLANLAGLPGDSGHDQ
jgi:hypothetical protein